MSIDLPAPRRHHFTRFDQINALIVVSEANPGLSFMARLMALCGLPLTNPGNRLQYKRVNRPYKLIMIAGAPDRPLVIGKVEIPCYVLVTCPQLLVHFPC